MLDSHIAPSAYSGRGTNWAALDHSCAKLEKLVLAEPPEHGKRARLGRAAQALPEGLARPGR